jgi:hypothetical protein
MKTRCALCGRPTTPYAYIGAEAIGPKCAQRAGLTPAKATKGGRIKFAKAPARRIKLPHTIDMFDEDRE